MPEIQKRELLRERVFLFVGQNPEITKSDVVKHFAKRGIPRRMCYNMLKTIEIDGTFKGIPRKGRPSNCSVAKTNKLKRLANNKIGANTKKL